MIILMKGKNRPRYIYLAGTVTEILAVEIKDGHGIRLEIAMLKHRPGHGLNISMRDGKWSHWKCLRL